MKIFRTITTGLSLWLGLILIAGLFSGGCQHPGQKAVFSLASECPHDFVSDRFMVGDLITLKFHGTVDPIPTFEGHIKEDGAITLPLVGDVKAAGKTIAELQKEVYRLYVPRFYKQLTIAYSPDYRVYYVGGQVRSPGRHVYLGATTVTKAIQSAGDFTDFAAKRRVELTRADGKKIQVNCIKAGKDSTLDLAVYPGDKIVVPTHALWDLFRW